MSAAQRQQRDGHRQAAAIYFARFHGSLPARRPLPA